MADTNTTNISLIKPQVGASADTWGDKLNDDMDIVDALFAADGTGTSVGLNVGVGKTLAVGGTFSLTGDKVEVSEGGTGAVSLTGLLKGNGVSPVSTAIPGTDYMTSVGVTAPVASTGGGTPTISMAPASSGVNGYMTGTYATKLDGVEAGATNTPLSSTLPQATGVAAIGVSTTVARSDHVHVAPTTITGNAGTATTANATNTANNYQMNSLGVGTEASGTAGEIRATNNITAYFSDDRLKIRIGNISNALDKVKSLNGFHYHANETAVALGYEVKPEVGVSAQEVQRVLPEVVVPAPIDAQYLTVHYDKIIPLLIEAIKELEQQVQILRLKG